MSQKFILFSEKTNKKGTTYEQDKQKRFTRRRNQRQKSHDSKKSKQQSLNSSYIKNAAEINPLSISRIHDSASVFIQKLSSTIFYDKQQREPQSKQISRKTSYNRVSTDRTSFENEHNFLQKFQKLQMQLQLKAHQLQIATAQCQRYKNNLDDQKQKRRKIQSEKRNLKKQIDCLQRQIQSAAIQNKKIMKQRQYLIKQVQFLQKINYDDKTRSLQSFRQMYLQEQVKKLRHQLRISKNQRESRLQSQLLALNHEKYALESSFKSLKISNEILLKKILYLQKDIAYCQQITRERVINSQEYIELRQKYKRFLDQYKELRTENWNLKAQINGRDDEELIFSQSEQQKY